MTTINPNSVNNKQEKDNWASLYLPAICATILMAGVLFLAISWSGKPQNAAKISAPTQQAPAVANPAPATPVASVPDKPKKIARKHRPTHATYISSEYGVSFSYPRKYSFQSGDKLAPLPVTYLKAGAVQVAAVDMPDDSYPESDFTSALLNVSVNKEMTAVECMQFTPTSAEAGNVKPTLVNVGATEYSVFEQINGEGSKKSDVKFFHVFKNNACYEFALAIDTTEAPEMMAQVDRGKIFQQLEKILTTARIKDLQPTDVENADKTPSTELPIADEKPADTKIADVKATDKTEKAEVVTPEQK